MLKECTPHFQADTTMMTTKIENHNYLMSDPVPDDVDLYSSSLSTDMRDDQQQYHSLGSQLQSLPSASYDTAGGLKYQFDPKTHKRLPGLQSVTKKKINHSVGYNSLSYSSGGDTKLNDSNQLMSLQSGGTMALSCSNSNQYSSLLTDSSSSHKDLIGSGAIPKVRSQAENLDGQARNLDGQARRTSGYQPLSGRHSLQTDSAESAILGINLSDLSIHGSESTGLNNSGSETEINGKQGNENQSKPQITSKVKGAERTTANHENQIKNSQINNSQNLENVAVENKQTVALENDGSVIAPEPQTQSTSTSSSSGRKKKKNKKKNKKNTTDSNSNTDSNLKVNGNEHVKSSKTNEKSSENVRNFIASLDTNDENNQTLEEIRAENKRLKEAKQCKICRDYDSNRMFLPCAHLAACSLCSPAVVNCPQCKAVIRGVVTVYFG